MMPTYDYECEKCGHRQEAFFKTPSLREKEIPCAAEGCDGKAVPVLSVPQKPYLAPPGGAKWSDGMGM